MSVFGNFLDSTAWSHTWSPLAAVKVLLWVGGWTKDLHKSLLTSIYVIIFMEKSAQWSTGNLSDSNFSGRGCKENLTKCAKLRSSYYKWWLCDVHHLAQKEKMCFWGRYYSSESQEGYMQSQVWHLWAFIILVLGFAEATRLNLFENTNCLLCSIVAGGYYRTHGPGNWYRLSYWETPQLSLWYFPI